MYEAQEVRLDPEQRRAWCGQDELCLSAKEMDLLACLLRHAGEVVSRRRLMREVWQTDFYTSTKTIDVHLGWLRRKLGDDARNPRLISTLRGQGLRFETTAARRETG